MEEPSTAAVTPSVLRPARRNLASESGSGVTTRARARARSLGVVTRARARETTVTFAEVDRNEDTVATAYMDTEDVSELLVMNALLQSDPQEGVPKNYKDLITLYDPLWQQSLDDELENFLKRDTWEFISRKEPPDNRQTLHCRWIFKLKSDQTRKSLSVIL
jgi:hypothetical protein